MNANAELDQLKKDVPMWAVAADRLKGMNKRGQEYDFLCPSHPDTSQSFQVYQEDDGTWLGHCQACGVTMNVFQLIQKTDGVDFKTAVKIVRELAANPEWEQMRADAEAVFQSALKNKSEIITAPLSAFDKYVADMQTNPTALAWLKSRGITKEIADQFSLGYVQQPLPQIVPTNHPWSNKGWIMFPEIRGGRIVAVKYRSVMGKRILKTDTEQGWSGFAQRKDMAKSPLYNQDAINCFDAVLVTEGEPDALILSQAAITGAVAVSLPSAGYNPNEEQRGALVGARARYLAGDMDEAGVNAMAKLHKELGGDNPHSKTYWLQWPKPYKDANQFFLESCGGDIPKFKAEVIRLMEEAKDRRLPGIRDLKSVTRNATFKPTHDNPNRLAFPWPNVDKWVDILPGEVMFMFATETKMGKSTWLMNILMHNVLRGKKIINFSAELSPERYAAMVTAHLIRANRNTLTESDFKKAAELIPDDSFYIGYKPGAKFSVAMKLLAEAKQVYGGDIFVVDPLHFLIRGAENENQAFADAMRQLVDFSIQWGVIVIAVGQARKSVAGSRGKMAVGQDARFSAALSEDAATTWIIHRNRVAMHREGAGEEGEPVFDDVTKIKLDLSRNSDPMSCKLIFNGVTASFNMFSGQMQMEEIRNDSNDKTDSL